MEGPQMQKKKKAKNRKPPKCVPLDQMTTTTMLDGLMEDLRVETNGLSEQLKRELQISTSNDNLKTTANIKDNGRSTEQSKSKGIVNGTADVKGFHQLNGHDSTFDGMGKGCVNNGNGNGNGTGDTHQTKRSKRKANKLKMKMEENCCEPPQEFATASPTVPTIKIERRKDTNEQSLENGFCTADDDVVMQISEISCKHNATSATAVDETASQSKMPEQKLEQSIEVACVAPITASNVSPASVVVTAVASAAATTIITTTTTVEATKIVTTAVEATTTVTTPASTPTTKATIIAEESTAVATTMDLSSVQIVYKEYESELQMHDIMRLIQAELSEPYSIYTYRYFIYNWPKLCFLAAHGDEYVGAIVCKLDRHLNVRRGYIAMLAVRKEYRKLRIGTTLVQKAIEAMLADNADEVVLETEMRNVPALRLYENLGFVRDKRLFRYYLNGVDALRLKLWFR